MGERRYTVSEIDRMREATSGLLQGEHIYGVEVRRAAVEDRLRTYLVAGVDPDELTAAALAHEEERHRIRMEEYRAKKAAEVAKPVTAFSRLWTGR